jgi:hypothetical protein
LSFVLCFFRAPPAIKRIRPAVSLEGNDDSLEGNDNSLEGNDNSLEGNDNSLEGNDNSLEGNDNSLEGNDDSLEENDDSLEENDDSLEGNDNSLEGNDDSLEGNDDSLEGNDNSLEGNDDSLEGNDNSLEGNDGVLPPKNKVKLFIFLLLTFKIKTNMSTSTKQPVTPCIRMGANDSHRRRRPKKGMEAGRRRLATFFSCPKLGLLAWLFLGFAANVAAQDRRQTSDSAYTRPLGAVLREIESRFGIQLKYDSKMIDNKTLRYADWRIKPWSAEESLRAVLSPFDYTFVMDNGKFKIKEFEYPRTSAEEGARFLAYLKTLYDNREEWEKRRTEIQSCLPQALRLRPLPARPPSEVILTPKRKYDGYTVENFAIETLPGIYVAGSIYKPIKRGGQCPVMLNPNGHFGGGRYRADQQFRCAAQARMGIIAVSWDLFAWGESLLQFDGSLHRLSAANSIQMLNAIRILDYLLSLKEADSKRVGVTGGSGGGSLTLMLAAMDPRITLSVPAVMLSSYFSGGCPCESGMPAHLCGGRTNNVEIAAMFAPKPQLILSDGKDWTSAVPESEYPFLQRVYSFYQAEDCLGNAHFAGEGHDYGPSKRQALYRFIALRFDLDIQRADESKVTIEKETQMYAFGPQGEGLPASAIRGQEALHKVLKQTGIY